MKIIEQYHDVPADQQNCSLAIGNFDGVHKGHQVVLEAAMSVAQKNKICAGVMVFEPHPRVFFQPQRHLFRLTSPKTKLKLFETLGLDMAAVMPFDAAMAGLTAEEFVAKVLVEGFKVRHVVTGFNFFFGKGRTGNPQVLKELGEKYGFGVTTVEVQGEAGDRFSSSRVRELLQEGDPRGAAEMLGYWWRIKGTVSGGAQRGGWLGFPTANITLRNSEEFHHGIYAVRVYIDGEVHHGAAYLGTRPTFDDGHPVLETFLFDFDRDIYGKEIFIELIEFIREDIRFKDEEELKTNMRKDCEKARTILFEIERADPMLHFPLGKTRHVPFVT
ncbi:MAG: bifunctional riboflavin kinase/FAD synthetase [Hyphomicrobiaceae bacterium]|nr:bifunctional riboflavin kinase/FAD synthetase [Hyphomicrobiaceae bacterium]